MTIELDALLDTIKEQPILQGLNDQQFAIIRQMLSIHAYEPHEILIEEGEQNGEIYFLLQGETQVLKWDAQKNKEFEINKLVAPNTLGELSFLDNSPRSTTIKALTPAIIAVLEADKFISPNEEIRRIYQVIVSNIANISAERLRESNLQHVSSLKSELAQAQKENDAGRLIILTAISFLFAHGFVSNLKMALPSLPPSIFSAVYWLLLLIPLFIFISHKDQPLSSYGIGFTNFFRSLGEGLLFSAVIVAIIVSGYSLISELLDWPSLSTDYRQFLNLWLISQLAHSYLQEFLARGLLQTAFINLNKDLNPRFGVLINSFLLSLLSIPFGLYTALVSFFANILLGFLYLRQGNLIGVTIVHAALLVTAYYCGISYLH